MADDLKPTLAQAKQIASGSWPTAWNVDSALAPEVLATEISRLEAENAALREDAERYRWLREGPVNFGEQQEVEMLGGTKKLADVIYSSDTLDAAIDAAMSKEEQRG